MFDAVLVLIMIVSAILTPSAYAFNLSVEGRFEPMVLCLLVFFASAGWLLARHLVWR